MLGYWGFLMVQLWQRNSRCFSLYFKHRPNASFGAT